METLKAEKLKCSKKLINRKGNITIAAIAIVIIIQAINIESFLFSVLTNHD